MAFESVKSSNLFPTIAQLNSYFRSGSDRMKDQNTLNWPPFSLNDVQYDEFHYWCGRICGELKIVDLDCGDEDHNKWFDLALSYQSQN